MRSALKKIITGTTLTAALGLSLFAAAPATAVEAPFENCTAAYEAGYSNIPSTDARYQPKLDRDGDGIGCDNPDGIPGLIRLDVPAQSVSDDERDSAVEVVSDDGVEVVETEVETAVAEDDSQVAVVPVGAADTGVAPAADPAAALAMGALGLAGVAGAAVVARRRAQA